MTQALVHMHAPVEIRGRVIGIHWSLALSAMALLGMIGVLLAFTLKPRAASP